MGLIGSKDGVTAPPEPPLSSPETPVAAPAVRRLRQLEDPRSPSCGIDRTPIEVGSNSEEKKRPARLSVGDTVEEEEEESRATEEEDAPKEAVMDPRSPSQEFERTPLCLGPERDTQLEANALAVQLDLVFLGLNTSDSAPGNGEDENRLEEVAASASTSAPPLMPPVGEQEPMDPTPAPQAPPPSPSEERPPSPVQSSPLCEAAINVLPELPIYCGSPVKAASPLRPVLKQRVGPRVVGVHSAVTPRSPLAVVTTRSPLTMVTPRSPLYLVSLGDCNSSGKPQRSAVTSRKGGSGEVVFVPARAGRKHERVTSGDKENSTIPALDE